MKLTKIEEEFFYAACIIGGVFLLSPEDGLRFVAEHRRLGIPILGIEGFHLFSNGQIQPDQDHTIDFDGETGESYEAAESFLKQRLSQELWFEIVAANPDPR